MESSNPTTVSVFIATSLDGYIARPDGDVAWLHEGEQPAPGEDAGYGEFFNSIDILVMGRGSFEKVLSFDIPWPYGDKPVLVLSKSLAEIPEALTKSVKIDSSSPQTLVERLTKEGVRRIYLDGGKVIQSFLREGLVDDMTLTTIPVLIGDGLPLFGHLGQDIRLRHISTQSWDNGFVQSKYEIVK